MCALILSQLYRNELANFLLDCKLFMLFMQRFPPEVSPHTHTQLQDGAF